MGSVRRKLLDQAFFWTATDLEKTLLHYQLYYNKHRCHLGRDGANPIKPGVDMFIDIKQLPMEQTLSRVISVASSGLN